MLIIWGDEMKKDIVNKVLSRLIRKSLRPFEMLKIIPPYDFVQIVNEQSVHEYLGVSK